MGLIHAKDSTNLGSSRLSGLLLAFHSMFLGYALLLNYLRESIGGRKSPYDLFLPNPAEWRAQFLLTNSSGGYSDRGAEGSIALIDTNVEVLLRAGLVRLFSNDYGAYFAISIISVAVSSVFIWKELRGVHVAVFVSTLAITILSYPSMLLLHRGDLFLVSLPLLLCSLVLFDGSPFLSALTLGFACTVSPEMLVFLIVPFFLCSATAGRKYLATSSVTYLASSIGAEIVTSRYDLSPASEDQTGWVTHIFASRFILPDAGLFDTPQYGHSMIETFRVIFGPHTYQPKLALITSLTLGMVAVTIALRFSRSEQRVPSCVWLLASCIGCLFVPSSENSRLLLLIPGFLTLVKAQQTTRNHYVLGTLIVIAIAPKPWGYIGWYPWSNASHWLTPLSLFAILILTTLGTFKSHTRNSIDKEEV